MAQSKFDIFKFDDAREKEEIRPGSKFNLFKFEDKKPKNEFKTSPNSDEKLQLKNLDLRNTLDEKPSQFFSLIALQEFFNLFSFQISSWSEKEIWYKAGQRSVVDFLKKHQERQKERKETWLK